MFSTGLRVSELVNLNRDKINLKTKEFNILGKGGKSRVIFLSNIAADWLGKYLATRKDKDKAVFVRHIKTVNPKLKTRNNKQILNSKPQIQNNLTMRQFNNETLKEKISKLRLTSRTIQRILNKYSKKAGITKKVTPHTLRHSFGTDLLRSGADIRAVQQLLGHASITTTQIYTHVTDQHLREVHQKFHGKK
ncbi:hypothetical protein A3F08_00005 [Candidatus Berkelbacteria bacterium RIFCSPHIGHO2_12_FULL_36_9]|uniref:Tyr recombinase domain-containing protein n=1 Tax=Candidatus Berkelbacteria bacterium RIFCSPHIGHO2_12_FULL_36_9 TaxID=1797469 RepID=A0A1F5EEY6_9BACT|nr:MAG: hypothetical protein A3F08_00005 [Candidatus Berkelbacteria bacterium RIFCSPHIGHO2_12_FULL_36_9]